MEALERTRPLGPDHTGNLRSMHALAFALKDCGIFQEAEALARTMLAKSIEMHGAEDRRTFDAREILDDITTHPNSDASNPEIQPMEDIPPEEIGIAL